jgi:hypothetical protein
MKRGKRESVRKIIKKHAKTKKVQSTCANPGKGILYPIMHVQDLPASLLSLFLASIAPYDTTTMLSSTTTFLRDHLQPFLIAVLLLLWQMSALWNYELHLVVCLQHQWGGKHCLHQNHVVHQFFV